ncbi:MAG: heme-binding domain-containing protein [Candidatus Methylomirabilis sp.]|nr:heme-binding domain-containing protein [Candidatus Methylomirabilis sp.]
MSAFELIPWGRPVLDLPVKAEPKWDSPSTRQLFFRACGDCHSNQTVLPWYDLIAPITWMINRDIEKGRAALNVSEWGREENEAGEAVDTIKNGSMPPTLYTLFHPSAKLSASDKETLVQGLVTTFGSEPKRDRKKRSRRTPCDSSPLKRITSTPIRTDRRLDERLSYVIARRSRSNLAVFQDNDGEIAALPVGRSQ